MFDGVIFFYVEPTHGQVKFNPGAHVLGGGIFNLPPMGRGRESGSIGGYFLSPKKGRMP